ncbi:mannitol dehydrogenase family protein [Aquincola sp. S2]|uniref:Mannitol dehydrogenase family protein n=1 Tax=Pseudaquabacterium terrae TaxID=2732868 RepID=A0ABX2ENX1_9BURK|nr:D-arabinitol 4-dehydrogenase [Aquabacterium terrae]NRF70241.1 mannitol dehydrogenase family protein [Aquabacterium terrae]
MEEPRLRQLHLGLGSFHRAHQAVYLHLLQQLGDRRWTLAAGNLRPDMAETVAALEAQQGAYTLETVSPRGDRRYERITAIEQVVPWQPGHAGLIALAADPATRIISFTVTEAGYYLDAHDRLDTRFADLAADLDADPSQPGGATTIYGALERLLEARLHANAGPLTLLNCDNLRHNGRRFRRGLLEFILRRGNQPLHAWVLQHTRCPNGMVDRITPRPTPEVRERVRQATGRDDPAALMGESFIQWVIEEDFIAGRPAWEKIGVQMVESVQPYEEAKLRLLNATHSCIAWAGTLRGLQFIHEGLADAQIRAFAHAYATDDAIPALQPSPIDLAAYRDTVLERFSNPAIVDTNQRVAMDGFSKLPGFIAPTIHERLAHGRPIAGVAVLPALFLAYLERWHRGTLPHAYQDQAMDEAEAHAVCASADPVAAFAAQRLLWGPLAGDARLVAALRAARERVEAFAATLAEIALRS